MYSGFSSRSYSNFDLHGLKVVGRFGRPESTWCDLMGTFQATGYFTPPASSLTLATVWKWLTFKSVFACMKSLTSLAPVLDPQVTVQRKKTVPCKYRFRGPQPSTLSAVSMPWSHRQPSGISGTYLAPAGAPWPAAPWTAAGRRNGGLVGALLQQTWLARGRGPRTVMAMTYDKWVDAVGLYLKLRIIARPTFYFSTPTSRVGIRK